jgi:hypothetical protein
MTPCTDGLKGGHDDSEDLHCLTADRVVGERGAA